MSDTQQAGLIPDNQGPQATVISLEDIKSPPTQGGCWGEALQSLGPEAWTRGKRDKGILVTGQYNLQAWRPGPDLSGQQTMYKEDAGLTLHPDHSGHIWPIP